MNFKKIYILTLFISFLGRSNNIELEKIFTDMYYYNACIKKGQTFLGTSNGIYLFDGKKNFTIINPKIIGHIKVENEKLVIESNPIFNNYYDSILPNNLRSKNISILQSKNQILICTRGKLLVYKKTNYLFYPIGSTRCFSENYIGTYDGVFYKNKKIKQPSYTSGKIKEFENETFICYDGLLQIKKSGINDYKNNKDFTTEIFGRKIKNSKDIIKISDNGYLLTTTSGLYKVNFTLNNITQILSCKNSYFKFLKIESDFRSNRVTFFDSEFIYVYSLRNNTIAQKKISQNIRDILMIREGVYYILTEDQLLFYDNGKINVLLTNLSNTHNIGLFYDVIYLTTNSELIIYNIKTREVTRNVIIDEFNNLAHIIKNDTLYLGTINGYYKFPYQDLKESINSLKYESNNHDNKSNTILILILALILLVILIFLFFKYRKESTNNIDELEKKFKLNLKEKFFKNVNDNISIVTVNSICEDLDLSYKELCEILKPYKPGDYISNQRKDLVKKLRKINCSEVMISKKTGFSLSYLKKIK